MLKQVLYSLMLAITVIRAACMGYLLIRGGTNVPFLVLAVMSCMIVYGIFLLVKRLFANVTLKQMMAFFMVESFAIIFNLIYISVTCPLRISTLETLVVGTFFDIIINLAVIYFCTKQIRSHYFAVAQPAVPSNRHV